MTGLPCLPVHKSQGPFVSATPETEHLQGRARSQFSERAIASKLLVFLFLLLPVLCFSQHEQSVWYFGQKAGLDFTNGTPAILRSGNMAAKGGGATMADAFGNLLFYTDGENVWNKNHQLMANGTGLKGNPGTTQTVVIVPRPLHRYRYYIFTTDARNRNSPNALRYSEVDMSLRGGLGEVVQKNILLLEDVSEKVTAALHYNNQDFWLLTHTWGTRNFYAYKIDSAGLSSPPVITPIGSRYSGSVTTGRGSFRLNNHYDYNATVVTLPDLNIFETFHFRNSTGVFEGFTSLSEFSPRAAFAEFSTFSRFYTVSTAGDEIFEFDMNGGSKGRIEASVRTIAKGTGFGDLRLARDGLIYVVSTYTNTLHTIEYNYKLDEPVYYAKPAIYSANAASLGSRANLEGLPNTIASYSQRWWGWGVLGGNCLGDTISYRPFFQNSVDSVRWDFDDPASGAENFSNEVHPTHVFKTPGKKFNIKATIYARGMVQEGSLSFDGSYTFDLGADTTMCFNTNQVLLLQPAVSGVASYKWQDGSTGPTYTVTKPGTYWLEVKAATGGCTYRDSIEVKGFEIPELNLGNDTTICTGKTLLLEAGNGNDQYLWQDGSAGPSFTVAAPGTYSVTVTSPFGCTATDSIKVYYLTPPAIDLGNDTTICEGTEIILDATLPGVSYKWQDGSTGPTYKVTQPGTYWVEGSIDVCSARDYIVISSRPGCIDNMYVPNIITPNGDGMNDSFIVLDPDRNNVWQLKVFNRMGMSVYKSNNYQNDWEAQGLPGGVYYYLLQNNQNRTFKGFVEVVR